MQDFQDHLTITMSGKNHYALLAFLKKHGGSKRDISRFIEEAVVLHIIDREMAFHRAGNDEGVRLFAYPQGDEKAAESWPV
jgi:hypothetical protein